MTHDIVIIMLLCRSCQQAGIGRASKAPFLVGMSPAEEATATRRRNTGRPVPSNVEEFLLGGVSTCVACFFSNPAEVIKTRMQLQGELQAVGTYKRHYRNVFHAAYTIIKNEGVLSIQKGLGPALVYQFVMNGLRLGTYQSLVNAGFTKNEATGESDFGKTVLAGAVAGCLGGVVASPLYLVKTHLQALSIKEIAVGHQHRHTGMVDALINIYREFGIRGLWRGVNGAVPRLMLGSALQLSTFSSIKETIRDLKMVPGAWVPPLAACVSSLNIVIFMEPLDVVRTRLYNQPVDAKGQGVLYKGFLDCLGKTFRAEGVKGLYKGAAAAFLRMAPQAVLGLSFWDAFRGIYRSHLGTVTTTKTGG